MYLLQVCVLGAAAVVALAQDCNPANCPPCDHGNPFCDHHGACHCHAKRQAQCTTSSDCPHTCPHGQHNVCEQVHGSGQGGGEWQCVCRHNKRMAVRQDCNPANCPPCDHGNPFCDHHGACHCHAKRQTQCTTTSDCPKTCGHGETNVCEQVHGTGQGGGEWQCVCRHNKRYNNVVVRQDCDPANCPPCQHGNPFCDHHGGCHCHAKRQAQCTTSSDCPHTCPHGQHNVCEQVHGSGQGGGEWQCVCRHNKRMAVPYIRRQTDHCRTDSDCASLVCNHGEHPFCDVNNVGGLGEHKCLCRKH